MAAASTSTHADATRDAVGITTDTSLPAWIATPTLAAAEAKPRVDEATFLTDDATRVAKGALTDASQAWSATATAAAGDPKPPNVVAVT
jgi:hypothetical protein